ncbi:MAG TPA: CCA tRNA nucleotidyltransferase [Chloroflexia bacterium]|nr:CCA tRNA nucleotidyltransferase [Chloroflexia bacterium]
MPATSVAGQCSPSASVETYGGMLSPPLCYNLRVIKLPDDVNSYIKERLASVLKPEMLDLLVRTSSLAAEHGWNIYLVGGYVRDVLLKIPDYDIDISVEGDAVALAALLAEQLNTPMQTHEAFGTAVLDLGGGLHLDFVTARKERYDKPGALPTVEPGTIEDDMARRDFTINALAVHLLPEGPGRLLDPHGGLLDLQTRLIRVLHDGSFRDDPTRIFRAAKLAERLGCKIEPHTLELVLQAVRDGALYTVSMDRISRELLLILEEPGADSILATLDHLGVLIALYPGLAWPYPPGHIRPAASEQITAAQRRDTYLAAIAAEFAAEPGEAERLARWLKLKAPHITLMRDAARLTQLWARLGEDGQSPSQTYHLLRALDANALEAYGRIEALAADAVPWQRLQDYLAKWRHVKTAVDGEYLKHLGVPQGLIYRQALEELLAAKLDGRVEGKEDEERFVEEWLKERGWRAE